MPIEQKEMNYEVCDLINSEAEERRQRYLTHHLLMMLRQAQAEEIERRRKEDQKRKVRIIAKFFALILAILNLGIAIANFIASF